MQKLWIVLAVAALAALGGCSSTGPASPTAGALQIAITPNPIAAVPGDAPHPFAISYKIAYRETGGVGLSVTNTQTRVVLLDGSVAIDSRGTSHDWVIKAYENGTVEYTKNSIMGQYIAGPAAATRPDGTLTITWQFTDDRGNGGTATASANVTG